MSELEITLKTTKGIARCMGYLEGLVDGAKLAQQSNGAGLVFAIEQKADEYEEKHAPKEDGK